MKVVRRTLTAALVLVAMLAGVFLFMAIPRDDPQPLPEGLIAATSPQGDALLNNAAAIEDYPEMSKAFEAQRLRSFCGVASSVIVLKSLGIEVTQRSLFNDRTAEVRPTWKIVAAGMTLDALGGILGAHGLERSKTHAAQSSVAEFRKAVARNLSTDDDYLLVNYQRSVLGQEAVGHISPVVAYDARSDRVLILDTAAYKYPPTWVPLPALFKAMRTIDEESGTSRGWIEVSKLPLI